MTILHRGERPLEQFDPDLVNRLLEATETAGAEVLVRHPVEAVESDGRGFQVHVSAGSGGRTVAADVVVHAAGDAAASEGLPLTPVAGLEGRTVAENLLKGNHRKPDYRACPSVVFTLPPLAAVGLTEAAAREAGLRFHVKQGDTSGWYSSRRVNESHSGFKVLIEEGTERILGAHLLGHHAEEVINVFALAMRAGLPASALKETLYAYPTSASDLGYMV